MAVGVRLSDWAGTCCQWCGGSAGVLHLDLREVLFEKLLFGLNCPPARSILA